MTATAVSTAEGTLVDPVTGEKVWAFEATDRHYVPQSLRGYLLGRILDIFIVTAAAAALTKGSSFFLEPVALMAQEWATVAVFGLILFAVIFLYGGIAGTIGTIGEAITGMRIVSIEDGSVPGFSAGGLRAVGWFLYVIFTLMLSDTGAAETRFIAVRRGTGVFHGEHPVSAAKAQTPHTDQS